MKFAQRLIRFVSPLIVCGMLFSACYGQEDSTVEQPVVDVEVEGIGPRPTIRQWNEFQETQEQILKENEELKGRMIDLLAGQREFRTRLENINNNLFNLINIVNETNNVNIGGDNCPFMGNKDSMWFRGTLYGLSALGVVAVLVWFSGLFKKKEK